MFISLNIIILNSIKKWVENEEVRVDFHSHLPT